MGFSKEQMEQLQYYFSVFNVSYGTKRYHNLTACGGLTVKGEPWIIDSGATDHMTGCAKIFTSYVPSPGNHQVRIADGSFSVVAGIGNIKINSEITLKAVLHVPNLSYNLLSISKLLRILIV